MGEARVCKVCGRDVSDDPGGRMQVLPDDLGNNTFEFFCAEHNPNPPTQEQLADMERQEFEAAVAALQSEVLFIQRLADLHRPVTPVDRANIALELLRILDRFIGQENKLRALEGKRPFPTRMEWDKPSTETR